MARRNEDKVVRTNNKKAHAKIKAQNRKETGKPKVAKKDRDQKVVRVQLKYGLGGEHVEGFHAVDTLINKGKRRVSRLFVDKDLADTPEMTKLLFEAERKHVRVTRLSKEQFLGRAKTEAPQGVIAYASEIKPKEVDDLLMNPDAFIIALDGITDPHNIGAIIRSAEVAGATGVVMPKHRSGHLSPAAVKAAAGAVEFINFALIPGMPAFLQKATKMGVAAYGMAGEASKSLYEVKESEGPLVIVMGSEGKGLSQLTRKRCDELLKIPQKGKTESLNVSAATAVTMMHFANIRL